MFCKTIYAYNPSQRYQEGKLKRSAGRLSKISFVILQSYPDRWQLIFEYFGYPTSCRLPHTDTKSSIQGIFDYFSTHKSVFLFHSQPFLPCCLTAHPLWLLGVLGGTLLAGGYVSWCHSGLLVAVIGRRAAQLIAPATDPLCRWWYLRVMDLGTLCKLHREAEN